MQRDAEGSTPRPSTARPAGHHTGSGPARRERQAKQKQENFDDPMGVSSLGIPFGWVQNKTKKELNSLGASCLFEPELLENN